MHGGTTQKKCIMGVWRLPDQLIFSLKFTRGECQHTGSLLGKERQIKKSIQPWNTWLDTSAFKRRNCPVALVMQHCLTGWGKAVCCRWKGLERGDGKWCNAPSKYVAFLNDLQRTPGDALWLRLVFGFLYMLKSISVVHVPNVSAWAGCSQSSMQEIRLPFSLVLGKNASFEYSTAYLTVFTHILYISLYLYTNASVKYGLTDKSVIRIGQFRVNFRHSISKDERKRIKWMYETQKIDKKI